MSLFNIGSLPSAEPWHDPDALAWTSEQNGNVHIARTPGLVLRVEWLEQPVRRWAVSISTRDPRLDPGGWMRGPLAHLDFCPRPTPTVSLDHRSQIAALERMRAEALSEAQAWAEETARTLETNRRSRA